MPEINVRVRIKRESNQSCRRPSSSTTSRQRRQVAARLIPKKSIFRAKDGSDLSIRIRNAEATMSANPVGTLIQNINGQEAMSVIQPPKTGPAAEEVTMQNDMTVITVAWRCGGNTV